MSCCQPFEDDIDVSMGDHQTDWTIRSSAMMFWLKPSGEQSVFLDGRPITTNATKASISGLPQGIIPFWPCRKWSQSDLIAAQFPHRGATAQWAARSGFHTAVNCDVVGAVDAGTQTPQAKWIQEAQLVYIGPFQDHMML